MALNKQSIPINFAQGLDLKTDPYQVMPGKFLALVNTIFTKGGLLQKRNGFDDIATISNASTITTFAENLISISDTLDAYSQETGSFVNSGFIQPLIVDTQSMVRAATSQTTVDIAIADNGLACTVWLDSNGNSYYQVSDPTTGQAIVPTVSITTATDVSATMPRVFALSNYFIITYTATVASTHTLRYIALPIAAPANARSPVTISTQISSISAAYDGIVANLTPDILYLAWNGSDGGGAIRIVTMDSSLNVSSATVISSTSADLISTAYDYVTNNFWLTYYTASGTIVKAVAYSQTLASIMTATTVMSSVTLNELTSAVNNNVLSVYAEIANTYSYSPNAKSDYIKANTLTLSGTTGTAGIPAVILRGVGLASKAIYLAATGKNYMLATYGQAYQPTYFLIDGSGNVLSKIAYSNGGGYAINQILPQIITSGTTSQPVLQVGYLFKDLLAAVNTQGTVNNAGLTPSPSPIFSQSGINLASFTLSNPIYTSEIGSSLQLGAGFEWMYDGVKPVEHGFHVWPEDITAVWSTSGGSIHAQPDGSTNTNAYYYQVCYEWTDGQGIIHRSAPSVPVAVTTTGSGSSGSIMVNIPYARLTYKTTNKIRIVIYRWSVAQPGYYRVTSITSPTLNDPTSDSVAYIDTLADASIIGNDLIYTTGGVVANIAAPGSIARALFDDRSWFVFAEDRNLLGFSKQVIENTPVEYASEFTLYVAPTTGAQGSTGPMTAIYPMDDKLVIFKKDAIYYINGTGPDNTNANNQYSQAIFVTSTVGTDNPASIVLTPAGLMFQSDKGIWLLGRDLSTTYIGAEVEGFNSQTVTSVLAVPATNQVRFTLDNNYALMYDYFYKQWGTFKNVNAISSCIYQGLHTYLNPSGQILQETPGLYADGPNPVLISFTTSWFNMAGLQGYERFYDFLLLGNYVSPHFLLMNVAYDYGPNTQQVLISPNNLTPVFGSDQLFGQTTPFGGPGNLEQWRVHTTQQTCQSFQISLQEIFNPVFAGQPGAGFTMSGINCKVGLKKGFRPIRAINSAG